MARFATIIIKNLGIEDVQIEDLGVSIPAEGSRNLTETFTLEELTSSSDLFTLIQTEDLVVNNGETDLSAADGMKHVSLKTVHQDDYDSEVVDGGGGGGGGWFVQPSPPSAVNGAGWFNTVDKLLYVYDEIRGSWLSASRQIFIYSKKGNVKNVYLPTAAGVTDPAVHYLLLRPITVTGIVCELGSTKHNANPGIRLKENWTNKKDYEFGSGTEILVPDENLNFGKGTHLRAYLWASKAIKQPFVQIEFAWRYAP